MECYNCGAEVSNLPHAVERNGAVVDEGVSQSGSPAAVHRQHLRGTALAHDEALKQVVEGLT